MKQNTPVALAYLVFAVLALLLVAPTMPPFQNADEVNHAFRADQISHLGFLPEKVPDGEQGGWIDSGLLAAVRPFVHIPFNRSVKVARAMYAPQNWGPRGAAGFPNTAIYPPAFYLPAAIAFLASRILHLTVLQGLELARLAGGMVAITLATFAIWLCEAGALWFFTVLLLPMSIALFAAVSQDGPMLASSALAACLVHRTKLRPSALCFAASVLLLVLIAAARPPYAGFALVLILARMSPRLRFAGISIVFGVTVAWFALVAKHMVLPVFPQGSVDPKAQFLGLVLSPSRIMPLLAATWQAHGEEVQEGFIGKLGWLDTDLPPYYHALAWSVLALAGLLCALGTPWRKPDWKLFVAGAGIGAAVLGVILIQYLTWSVPRAAAVEGLQGRYFLPPAIMLACLFPARPVDGTRLLRFQWPLLALPIVTIPVTLHAIIIRYFL